MNNDANLQPKVKKKASSAKKNVFGNAKFALEFPVGGRQFVQKKSWGQAMAQWWRGDGPLCCL
jgi:hypothetical protein